MSSGEVRLPRSEPTFYPNDIEAVWQLAEDRYVRVIQDANRAGGAVSMIWVDDPESDTEIQHLSSVHCQRPLVGRLAKRAD